MNILLTGASGLIGRAINSELTKQGNTVYPLVRNRREGPFFYMQETDEIFLDLQCLDHILKDEGHCIKPSTRAHWKEQNGLYWANSDLKGHASKNVAKALP